jgi:hypothetical protein
VLELTGWRAHWLRQSLAVALAVVALLTVGCSKPLAENECLALLDRYTELLVKEEDPKATPQEIAHDQEAARTAAQTEPRFEFALCAKKVKRHGFECAMAAPSVDAIERCLVF